MTMDMKGYTLEHFSYFNEKLDWKIFDIFSWQYVDQLIVLSEVSGYLLHQSSYFLYGELKNLCSFKYYDIS
jgi:hypothetical protein